ncbi:MAG TPA: molybdopterin-binding protein, partial [Pseudonocardiaceae bacterium]|nr:molybdopterin-binding protein [Pseudonocardiaceae bacterium]
MTAPRTDGEHADGTNGTNGTNTTPPRRAVVVVASNRASAGVYADRTGPIIVDWLREHGYQTPEPLVVPDGSPVRDALAGAVADAVDVVLTTG